MQRNAVRQALAKDGVAVEIDSIVKFCSPNLRRNVLKRPTFAGRREHSGEDVVFSAAQPSDGNWGQLDARCRSASEASATSRVEGLPRALQSSLVNSSPALDEERALEGKHGKVLVG